MPLVAPLNAATSNTTEPVDPWSDISDGATSEADYLARLNDPARSDLPPQTAATLAQLGADVVRADLSGEGRERFPGYWSSAAAAATARCTDVVIEAAGAASLPGSTGSRVAVVWSGVCGSVRSTERTTVVYFADIAGQWRPQPRRSLP